MATLSLPRAFPPLSANGLLRRCPEDFVVEELASHAVDERGDHLLLWIEKRGANSAAVAAELASVFDVAPIDVSFAGMKDRHAVARQWFSVRTARAVEVGSGNGWRILGSQRGERKLRRGDLVGNSFTIRLHDVCADRNELTERLETLRAHGVPNYFGEQRFGRDGANVERARVWICRRPRASVSAFEKGLHLSTARALLFNAVLGERITSGTWQTLLAGDVADGDCPTGPLWGRGRRMVSGCALHHEDRALAPYVAWLDPMEHLGLRQERRALVARPSDLCWSFHDSAVEFKFGLAAGQYATAVLREIGTWRDAAVGSPA